MAPASITEKIALDSQSELSLENRISAILLEYAQVEASTLPLAPKLSLKNDLAIESLSLVSVVLRLGDELGVDVVDSGLELTTLKTVADLVALGRDLQTSKSQ